MLLEIARSFSWRISEKVARMTELLFETRDVHTHYSSSHVLRGVNFDIKVGETVALVGRNGMGKTTFIKTLLQLVKKSSGSIDYRGQDVSQLRTHALMRLGIGYVPEGRGIFPNLSVKENLLIAARQGPTGRKDWTYDRVLDTFPRLSERLQHGGQQLSGGEQQMLSIGRALMSNPDLIILDEATEGLAPIISREIWSIMRRIRDTGISSLIVDKNFVSLSKICDRSVVMLKGKIVFNGAPQELIEDPVNLRAWLGV